MPWIIDYPIVLEEMTRRGFRCNYHNSGAFAFDAPAGAVTTLAWIGPDDPTIRESFRPLIRPFPEPYEPTLARAARKLWLEQIGGAVWAMPTSHWAYELEHGSGQWMCALIDQVGLDSGHLLGRNNGSAIEFQPAEADAFETFVQRLLEMLLGSDFLLVFRDKPILCMVHHHKQLWWQSTDPAVTESVRSPAGISPLI